jgi:hypothetical protein
MNNIHDNKGQIHVQGPSTTCTLLINHIVTPPPNLSTPNNDYMVISKLNSLKLKEELKQTKKYCIMSYFQQRRYGFWPFIIPASTISIK